MATLKLNPSPYTAVFRRIVKQLAKDEDFKRVVSGDRLRSWDGSPADKAPLMPSPGNPVVRLTPTPEAVDWFDPSSQAGQLVIVVELAVAGLCIDDLTNLWGALVTALSPDDAAFVQDLVAAGAEVGELVFAQPAVDPRPQDQPEGLFLATGRMRLRIVRSVNP